MDEKEKNNTNNNDLKIEKPTVMNTKNEIKGSLEKLDSIPNEMRDTHIVIPHNIPKFNCSIMNSSQNYNFREDKRNELQKNQYIILEKNYSNKSHSPLNIKSREENVNETNYLESYHEKKISLERA